MEVAAALGANTTMRFLAPSELAIDDAGLFGINVGNPLAYAGPQLANFGAGDTIDLKSFAFANVTLSPLTPTGVLQVSNSASQVADLAFKGSSPGPGQLIASSDHGTGTLLTFAA